MEMRHFINEHERGIGMNIGFNKGQIVSTMVYSGPDGEKAKDLYDQLDNYYKRKAILYLEGCDFSLRLITVVITETPYQEDFTTIYTIQLKGELI